jgi:di/tricarboxylate transporter
MLFARRWLGRQAVSPTSGRPTPRLAEWIEEYGLTGREHHLRVARASPLIGKRLDELDLRARDGINIIGIERSGHLTAQMLRPRAETVLREGDRLFVDAYDRGRDVDEFWHRLRLECLPLSGEYFTDHAQEIGMAELLIPATSRLIGKTLIDFRFRTQFDLAVIGLKRGQTEFDGRITAEPLRVGDTLLVVGPWRAIRRLQAEHRDLIVLALPAELEDVVPAPSGAPFAIAILALVVTMMATGVVMNVQAALIGGLLLGLFGCVDMASAYRSIHWQTLILIVGMLPFSLALRNTGGVELAAELLLGVVGDASPRIIFAAVFLLTALLGMFISNTATAVLMAPVALAIASNTGLSPYPFAMCVALAASTAFMTPVSSPVNTLVVLPGSYTFGDFVRVGVPFSIAAMLTSIILVPLVFPF